MNSHFSVANSVLAPPYAIHIRKQLWAMGNLLAENIQRASCPVRRSFIEREPGVTTLTPLAALLRTQGSTGGKGGNLRIALLLSLIWVNAKPPYSTRRVAAYWSELLEQEDPRGEGARSIRDALHELAFRGFISVKSSGPKTEITLRNEAYPFDSSGDPKPYTPPYRVDAYVQVPKSFWTDGLAGSLSGAAIAMYLCALALTRSDDPEFFIAQKFFDEKYGISRSSRKRGLAELIERGVLIVRVQEEVDELTHRKLRRNIYQLTQRYVQPEAWTPPENDEESKLQRATEKTRLLKELEALKNGQKKSTKKKL